MTAEPDYYRRASIERHGFHTERMEYVRDGRTARKCATCGKRYLRGGDRERKHCNGCIQRGYSASNTTGLGRPSHGARLDDVRAGTWTPTPELADTLRYMGQEISPCRGCGKVRLRLVGQWCGGDGCEKQERLF